MKKLEFIFGKSKNKYCIKLFYINLDFQYIWYTVPSKKGMTLFEILIAIKKGNESLFKKIAKNKNTRLDYVDLLIMKQCLKDLIIHKIKSPNLLERQRMEDLAMKSRSFKLNKTNHQIFGIDFKIYEEIISETEILNFHKFYLFINKAIDNRLPVYVKHLMPNEPIRHPNENNFGGDYIWRKILSYFQNFSESFSKKRNKHYDYHEEASISNSIKLKSNDLKNPVMKYETPINYYHERLKTRELPSNLMKQLHPDDLYILTELGMPLSTDDYNFSCPLELINSNELKIGNFNDVNIILNLNNRNIYRVNKNLFLAKSVKNLLFQCYILDSLWNEVIKNKRFGNYRENQNHKKYASYFKEKLLEIDSELLNNDNAYYWGSLIEDMELGIVG